MPEMAPSDFLNTLGIRKTGAMLIAAADNAIADGSFVEPPTDNTILATA